MRRTVSNGEKSLATVGYCTTYAFYHHPDKIRFRISYAPFSPTMWLTFPIVSLLFSRRISASGLAVRFLAGFLRFSDPFSQPSFTIR